jgi:hypothetical protein
MVVFQWDFPLSLFALPDSHVMQAVWHIVAHIGTLWHKVTGLIMLIRRAITRVARSGFKSIQVRK